MDFFNTTVTPQAIELAVKTMESTYLSEGAVVRQFELALQRELGLHNVVTVNSGTSALHLALIAAGVKPGDEVITTAQTFIASSLAILYCGAVPVYADIDPLTGNLTPESIESKITEKTKAILPVSWGGYPVDLMELCNLAFLHGDLPIIHDAAHALGATYRHTPIGGTKGEYPLLTCFSFQAIKHLTVGDGGAVCGNKECTDHIRKLRWFGIDRENDKPDELGERRYELTEIGYKYHMNDIAASIGLGNLVGFKDRLARRRDIASMYFRDLSDTSGVTLMDYKVDRESSYWLFPIRVESRLEFARMMKSKGIPVSVVHRRIDHNPLFGGLRDDLPGLELFDNEQVNLPIHENLSDGDVENVINAIRGGW